MPTAAAAKTVRLSSRIAGADWPRDMKVRKVAPSPAKRGQKTLH
jgi:hypothetical protein